MTTGCNASLGLAGAVHDCDWTEPHPGHAHHNHQAGATWTGATWRDLATLRAEVEALQDRVSDWCDNLYEDAAARSALNWVLDLIDKRGRP